MSHLEAAISGLVLAAVTILAPGTIAKRHRRGPPETRQPRARPRRRR